MFKRNTLLVASIVALAAVLATASIHAFPATRYNMLTFNGAVGLPGVTLPAGTYRFEIANPEMNGDIVRVSSGNGRVYYTGFTTAVRRPRSMPKKQAIAFGESVSGAPAPITVWFPLDSSDGHQFRY
jgi:hypothetical protein